MSKKESESKPIETANAPLNVQEPGTSGETIRQRKLREFYEIEQEYREAKNRYYRKYGEIQQLLMGGADVQGGQYGVKYGVRYVRRPAYKQIVIDLKGESYQKNILEHTKPHAHFAVRLVPPKTK